MSTQSGISIVYYVTEVGFVQLFLYKPAQDTGDTGTKVHKHILMNLYKINYVLKRCAQFYVSDIVLDINAIRQFTFLVYTNILY